MNLSELCSKNSILSLKNSMINKKGVIFLCGQNLHEHKNRFSEILNNKEFVTLAYKNSYNILPSDPDILFLDTRIKDTKIPPENVLIIYNNDDSGEIYEKIPRNNEFKPHIFINSKNTKITKDINYIGYGNYVNYKFDQSITKNIITNANTTDNYSQCLMFMDFLGIKEIYIFGAYNIAHPDVRNNRYSHHFNNIHKKGGYVIETGHMMHALSSHWWYKYLQSKKVKVYNVSKEGSLCNLIHRINFDEIFKLNKKIIDVNKNDCCLFSLIKNRLDTKYYSRCAGISNDFDKCLNHYIWKGYFAGCKLNKNDNHSMIEICKPLYKVIINKEYDIDIIFLFLLFKFPKMALNIRKKHCEFAFQNHVMSPLILNNNQSYFVPVTFNDCDKLIVDQNFDYIQYKIPEDGETFIGKKKIFKLKLKEIKHLFKNIPEKYISFISYFVSKNC